MRAFINSRPSPARLQGLAPCLIRYGIAKSTRSRALPSPSPYPALTCLFDRRTRTPRDPHRDHSSCNRNIPTKPAVESVPAWPCIACTRTYAHPDYSGSSSSVRHTHTHHTTRVLYIRTRIPSCISTSTSSCTGIPSPPASEARRLDHSKDKGRETTRHRERGTKKERKKRISKLLRLLLVLVASNDRHGSLEKPFVDPPSLSLTIVVPFPPLPQDIVSTLFFPPQFLSQFARFPRSSAARVRGLGHSPAVACARLRRLVRAVDTGPYLRTGILDWSDWSFAASVTSGSASLRIFRHGHFSAGLAIASA